jgi:pilus assembly protein CpaB
MNAKRLTLALFVSLMMSGVFTFWLSRHVAKTAHGTTAPKRWVVAAGKPLEAGEMLKPGSLRLVEWPVALPGSFAKIDELKDRIMLYPVTGDQPILSGYLAPPGATAGLAAKIPAGMRAISVHSDEVVGVAGFLLPGTHVDVLLTYHTDRNSDPRTATVLQDVVVLAAGQQIRPDPEGRPASVTNVVTLMLKPEDSEKLVLATSLGAIHFILRNGSDEGQSSSSSVGLDELAGPANVSGADQTAGAKGLLPRKPYQVETVLGDKRIVKTFN